MPTTVFDASATLAGTDDSNGNGNLNFRQMFGPAGLAAATGTQVRLTFLFGTAEGSETPAVDAVWFGQKSTTAIANATDAVFNGNQVQVLFGGSGSANGSAAGTVVSDLVTLGEPYDNTKAYMAAWHAASGKNVNISFATFSNVSQAANLTGGASTASQTTASPAMNFITTTAAGLISKIEIQALGGFVPYNPWPQAAPILAQ